MSLHRMEEIKKKLFRVVRVSETKTKRKVCVQLVHGGGCVVVVAVRNERRNMKERNREEAVRTGRKGFGKVPIIEKAVGLGGLARCNSCWHLALPRGSWPARVYEGQIGSYKSAFGFRKGCVHTIEGLPGNVHVFRQSSCYVFRISGTTTCTSTICELSRLLTCMYIDCTPA